MSKVLIETENQPVLRLVDTKFLDSVCKNLSLKKETAIYFLTDNELLEVNNQTLNHDYYTDIITFDYTDDDDIEYNEILISWDRVVENANTFNRSPKEELHRICIHGLLHLAGQDDKSPQDKTKMTELENHYLALHCST